MLIKDEGRFIEYDTSNITQIEVAQFKPNAFEKTFLTGDPIYLTIDDKMHIRIPENLDKEGGKKELLIEVTLFNEEKRLLNIDDVLFVTKTTDGNASIYLKQNIHLPVLVKEKYEALKSRLNSILIEEQEDF